MVAAAFTGGGGNLRHLNASVGEMAEGAWLKLGGLGDLWAMAGMESRQPHLRYEG